MMGLCNLSSTKEMGAVMKSLVWLACFTFFFDGLMAAEPAFKSELIFPLNPQHNHAPGIVECPNGDLFVTWYRGSGERRADDVAVYAAWKRRGQAGWSEPFVLADTPGFPDCNTALFVDRDQRLWLIYPTILANSWESCLTNIKVAKHYSAPDKPHWDFESMILLKPDDFAEPARKRLDEELAPYKDKITAERETRLNVLRERLGEKLYQRLGWQPRCKPTQLPSGRILIPLYTDTFSISIMAITDDGGKSWHASQPLLGFGNIQPTVLRRNDGTLVAYMRENGLRGKIRVCESKDEGETWGTVGVAELPNPGSGVDGVRLASGKWLLVYNDTNQGRNRLAVSLSADEGRSWTTTRHLEDAASGSYHYPAVTQGADGTIHVVYSYFVEGGKSMKVATFEEAWIAAGSK
jgi:predicted neuraminidase